MTKEKFNELDSDAQWVWLINLTKESKKKIDITIDNDCTSIWVNETEELFLFKDDLGSRSGAKILLTVLGYNVEYA